MTFKEFRELSVGDIIQSNESGKMRVTSIDPEGWYISYRPTDVPTYKKTPVTDHLYKQGCYAWKVVRKANA